MIYFKDGSLVYEYDPVGNIVVKCQDKTTCSPNSFIPNIKRIIYSDKHTIVIWEDGSKTIVKCAGDETFDEYTGFCAAVAKKLFKSTSAVKKVIERKKHVVQQKPKGDTWIIKKSCDNCCHFCKCQDDLSHSRLPDDTYLAECSGTGAEWGYHNWKPSGF